jgi:macrocin-O-methyltransferase TylF-like protien
MGLLAKILGGEAPASEFADEAALKQEVARLRGAYLELMKDCIIGNIYRDPGNTPVKGEPSKTTQHEYDAAVREFGQDWPFVAHSMIGNRRMINLWTLCEDVIARGVPGDFIETGVWRGGACIFMRALLKVYGVKDRTVWVADSFEGLPPPNEEKYPLDRGWDLHLAPQLAVSVEEVRRNFQSYGLLDDQVRFLKGWFKDTLPSAPIQRLAVLRLDGDLYESTMDALHALYDKLSPGGYAIIDDFEIDACRIAVEEFRRSRGIEEPIQGIDVSGVFWQKRAF